MDFLFEIAKNRYNECNRTTFDVFYDELKTNEGERLIDRILSVWNDTVKCFNRLQKAYYDYDAYHLIGYCNTQKKIDISNRNFQSLGMPSRRSPYTASCRSMPASSQSIRPRPSSALSFL